MSIFIRAWMVPAGLLWTLVARRVAATSATRRPWLTIGAASLETHRGTKIQRARVRVVRRLRRLAEGDRLDVHLRRQARLRQEPRRAPDGIVQHVRGRGV